MSITDMAMGRVFKVCSTPGLAQRFMGVLLRTGGQPARVVPSHAEPRKQACKQRTSAHIYVAHSPAVQRQRPRVQEPEQGAINSLDFHRTQDFLVAGHQRGFISVYSTHEGRKLATLDCTKYGVSHVRYTHHPKCVVHASTKVRRASVVLGSYSPNA